jgi:hypothetical protein
MKDYGKNTAMSSGNRAVPRKPVTIKHCYYLRPIILFVNIDVSRYIIIINISVLVKSNMDGGSTAFALAEWRGVARFQRLVNKVKATQESKQAHLLCSLSCAWFGAVCRLAVPAAATAAAPVWSGGALLLQLTTRSFIHSRILWLSPNLDTASSSFSICSSIQSIQPKIRSFFTSGCGIGDAS